jgi:hypothetical protein
MNTSIDPTSPKPLDFINIKSASSLYAKHSSPSLSRASDVFAMNDAELVHDLKRALLVAIECGNFDKALFILKQLQSLASGK